MPVGPAARGKSTLARGLISAGLDPANVLSVDTLRGQLCKERPCACADARPDCPGGESCMCITGKAVRVMEAQATARATARATVFFDSTHLRQKSWRIPLAYATGSGLAAHALLFAPVDVEVLRERNASRSRQVPDHVLVDHVRLHALITPEVLRTAGFTSVHLIDDETEVVL